MKITFPLPKNLVWKKCSCNFISYLSCFKGQNFRFGNKNAEKKKWLATFETFKLWLSLIDEKVLKRSYGIFLYFWWGDSYDKMLLNLTIYCLNKNLFLSELWSDFMLWTEENLRALLEHQSCYLLFKRWIF